MGERKYGSESEPSLVRRIQDGDPEAFDELYERQRRKLFAYVLGLLRDEARSEDIVQDCFVELVRRISTIDARRGASGWLWRVARNKAFDAIRRRKLEERHAENLRPETEKTGETPAGQMMASERQRYVRGILDLLPPSERDLLLLRFYGGLSFKQMARVVRRPLGTVLWQVRRSLEKLAKRVRDSELGREMFDNPPAGGSAEDQT